MSDTVTCIYTWGSNAEVCEDAMGMLLSPREKKEHWQFSRGEQPQLVR